jgi:hypothetical protein
MFDRIHWFQGWVIILLIFIGISMLVHYERAGQVQLEKALQTSIALEEQRHAATLRHQAMIIKGIEELKAMLKAHDDWQSGMVTTRKGGPQSRPYKGPPQ